MNPVTDDFSRFQSIFSFARLKQRKSRNEKLVLNSHKTGKSGRAVYLPHTKKIWTRNTVITSGIK